MVDPLNTGMSEQIESIADQLCLAVQGDFNFTVQSYTEDQTIQKLCMLLNFVIDTARRALSEVNEQNIKLTELDKLKSEFMANVSHELRTPLTLILGPLETILAAKNLSVSEYQDHIYRMHRNAIRLYTLVNDLLDFSKLEAGKFTLNEELIDLNNFIALIIEDAQGLALERGLQLTFSHCNNLRDLFLDPRMIEKIVLNLISNALKFTPEGGSINVELQAQGDIVQLKVEDTGIGIPEDQISKLFDRFYQVDSSTTRTYEGTGIGLALIHQVVQVMGGNITVKSEVGKGSQFTVSFPIKNISVEEAESANQTKTIKKEAKVRQSITSNIALKKKNDSPNTLVSQKISGNLPLILVADDNEDMRSYIISLLEHHYDIVAVENGEQALKAIYQYNPRVILSDVMMPVMDGFQLAQSIKQDPKIRHIPIILITAKAGKETIVSGVEAGADDYLSKPFSPEELKARTQSALRQYEDFMKIHRLNNELNDLIQKLTRSTQKLEVSNKKLKKEINHRKSLEAQLESKNFELSKELIIAARRAGMSDIATSTLHNVGNILNTVNVSTTMIGQKISNSKISNLMQVSQLLQQHETDVSTFLSTDHQGQVIPRYLVKLSNIWEEDRNYLLHEVDSVKQGVDHIKEIIKKQNMLSGMLGTIESVSISELVEDALALNKATYERAGIEIVRNYDSLKPTVADRVKLLQIIVNLIKNSIESLIENGAPYKKLTLSVEEKDETYYSIVISDNGKGISPDNLLKIFSFGFTTKKTGHGFGLHSSAIYAQEMGGNLRVESEGIGKGASFIIQLPYQPGVATGEDNV